MLINHIKKGNTMRRLYLLTAILLATLPVALMAQDTRNAELAHADAQLNSSYRALMRRLSSSDQNALRKAQRAWLAFRDADCAFGWPDRRECLAQRTEERTQQLMDSPYFNSTRK
ncbi:lysozyme inhibitor LprI family protein [Sphingobium sp. AN641]|uniref:lysozyme inhibitor LprI family protein n=1 Tax=Sphingobium sp. AN641 TaxID=3133443 RepID=UPI0030BB3C54